MIELSRPSLLDDGMTLASSNEDSALNTVLRSQSFIDLVAAKRRVVLPLLTVSFAYIFGVALLAGYAPGLMSLKVAGSFNVGYLLVLAIYVLCWFVSVVYVNLANRSFETRAANLTKEFSGDIS